MKIIPLAFVLLARPFVIASILTNHGVPFVHAIAIGFLVIGVLGAAVFWLISRFCK